MYGRHRLTTNERAANRGNLLLAMHEQLLTDEDRGENTVTPPGEGLGLNSNNALLIVAEDAIAAVLTLMMELDVMETEARAIYKRAMKRVWEDDE